MKTLLAVVVASLLAPWIAAQENPPEPVKPGTVELWVLDEREEGIFRATVSLLWTEEDERRISQGVPGRSAFPTVSVRTDPDGFATVSLPAGEPRTLRVRKFSETDEATVEIERLQPGEVREVEVRLKTRPDLDVTGHVVDADTGAPLAGVEVHVARRGRLILASGGAGLTSEPLELRDPPDAVSNEAGEFTVRVKSWTAATVTLTGHGRSPVVTQLLGRRSRRPSGIPIRMGRSATVRGAVRSVDSAVPPGSDVVLETGSFALRPIGDRSFAVPRRARFSARIDAQGCFVFDDLPSDAAMSLTVKCGRDVLLRESVQRTFAAGAGKLLELVLGAGRRVHGVVVEADGTPVPRVEVWLQPGHGSMHEIMRAHEAPVARVTTDRAGRFSMDDVDPGTWRVGLCPDLRDDETPDTERCAPVAERIDVDSDDVALRLVNYRGLYIEGTIEGVGGAAPPRNVNVSARQGGAWFSDVSPVEGKFRIGPLMPGSWTVTASVHGLEGDDRCVTGPVPIQAEAGGDPVTLPLRPGCGLSISAVDAESSEVVPAFYSLHGEATTFWRRSGRSRDVVELWSLEPDVYTVLLRTEDDRVGAGTFDLVAGQLLEEQRVIVRPGGTLEVSCDEAHIVRVLQGDRIVGSDSGGRTIVVPPGDLTVRVTSLPGSATPFVEEREVHVRAGQWTRVEITVDRRRK